MNAFRSNNRSNINFHSVNSAEVTAAIIYRWNINCASAEQIFPRLKTLASIAIRAYVTTSEVERNDWVDSCGLPQN